MTTAPNNMSNREALRASDEPFRLLVEGVVDYAIFMLDTPGHVVSWNAGAERIKGYRANEIVGQHFSRFYPAEEVEAGKPDRELVVALAEGRYEEEGWRVRKDGSLFWANVVLTTLRDETGEPRGFAKVTRDLTERRRAEEQLAETRTHLAQAQKMEAVGRLAGGIAHDFNNLLTVINALSITILKRLPAGDPLRSDLEEIHGAGVRAANLTRQLLTFSRRHVMQQEAIDLNTLVLSVGRMIGRLIGEDVTLRLALAPDLGIIKGDRGQMEQVIINLALNARDAMPEGGNLTIETTNTTSGRDDLIGSLGLPPGSYAKLVVTDTGTGMDPLIQAQIFEPFFTTKGQGEGTGLGLATVYGIIQQSGGSIEVQSQLGQGSSFIIYLPHAEDSTGPAQASTPAEAVGGSEIILLVEDDPSVRRLTANLLRDYGYSVLDTGRPEDALAIAAGARRPVNLLLTDVVMPGQSGPELAARLAAQSPAVRVLYMSGYSDLAARHGPALSDVPLLQKPFTPEGLARKVREVLDRKYPAEPAS